jgi:hypothetical protein
MLTLLKGRWNVLFLPSSKPSTCQSQRKSDYYRHNRYLTGDAPREDRVIKTKTQTESRTAVCLTERRKAKIRKGDTRLCWWEDIGWSLFQRQQRSKVFCILFFFRVWLDKQFINSDRWSLKSFQTTAELVGNCVRSKVFL